MPVNSSLILAGVSSKLSAPEIENHLEQGKRLLASGQLSDALVHYHAAVGEWKYLELNLSE